MNELKEQVLSIIKVLESGIDLDGNEIDVCDYMQDVLDINYIVNADKTYKGARLLVAFGGPNIWIDTLNRRVESYWWSHKYEGYYHKDALGLDDYCSEIFKS